MGHENEWRQPTAHRIVSGAINSRPIAARGDFTEPLI